jgi:hypothetical protein
MMRNQEPVVEETIAVVVVVVELLQPVNWDSSVDSMQPLLGDNTSPKHLLIERRN